MVPVGWTLEGCRQISRVTGWHLDRERLATVTSVVAPGVPVIDISTGPGPGIDEPGQTASTTELGPPD